MSTLTTSSRQTLLQALRENLRNYSMFIILAAIMIGFAILTNGVNLVPRNVTNIFIQNSYILVLAVGMVMVIIVGNIDLSVGSVAAFTGAIGAIVYNAGVGLFLTILITIVAGLAIGAFQGYWIAYLRVPAFIVTLGGLLLFRGLTYIITNVTPITPRGNSFRALASGALFPDWVNLGTDANPMFLLPLLVGAISIAAFVIFAIVSRNKKKQHGFDVGSELYFYLELLLVSALIALLSIQFARYRGVPMVFVILAITIAIFTFITNKTVFGRNVYAVGGNAKSAKLSGINSELTVFLVHTIMGGLAGLCGILFTAYMNSALPAAGNLFELEAIAAAFIGGASATGGIGTIMGAIIGGLVMGAINNGMSLMNISVNWQYVVKALVLLLAVWYDIYTRKKSGTV